MIVAWFKRRREIRERRLIADACQRAEYRNLPSLIRDIHACVRTDGNGQKYLATKPYDRGG